MVFAHRCYTDAINNATPLAYNENIPDWNATGTSEPKEMILITQSLKELQQVMSDYVGIVRNDVRLQRAMRNRQIVGIAAASRQQSRVFLANHRFTETL